MSKKAGCFQLKEISLAFLSSTTRPVGAAGFPGNILKKDGWNNGVISSVLYWF